MKRVTQFLCIVGFLLVSNAVLSEINPAKIFSDHMVIQRDVPAPLWGTARPGSRITAEVNGLKAEAIAGKDGKWMIKLPSQGAGGPYLLKLTGDGDVEFSDVLVGDVWVASGQSNMAWSVGRSNNAEKEIAAADYPSIRLFEVDHIPVQWPAEDLQGGSWKLCSPEAIRDFSGVAYFFGRELFKDIKVPIGLVNCNWGGTLAEAWTSAEMLKSLPDFRDRVIQMEHDTKKWTDDMEANDERAARKNEIIYSSKAGVDEGVHLFNYKDGDWKIMVVPEWDEDLEGVLWLRKFVEVPKEYKKQKIKIDLGRIENYVTVYFNGYELGSISSPNYVTFEVPAEYVKIGENRVALRVIHKWGKPNMVGPKERMKVTAMNGAVIDDLSGTWRYKTGVEPEFPEVIGYQNKLTALYNGMLAPIIPYGIKGVIWYQGESNASRANQYRDLFPAMIEDWRVRWGQGYFPFLFVQLANYMDQETDPEESAWAELREAQMMTLNYPATGMAVTIDIGEEFDIHPKNKQDVGKRLAQAAKNIAYGQAVVPSGPVYKSMRLVGSDIEISFDYVGTGLMGKDGPLTGFTMAGEDRKFHKAKASIAGGKVIVTCSKVSKPAAVRYAWANNPVCNLYNKEGLPASPFRTDDWKGVTTDNR